MKNHSGYLPSTDKEKAIWLKNFELKLSRHSENLGILPEEMLEISNDAAAFVSAVEFVESDKRTLAQSVAFKQQLAMGNGIIPITSQRGNMLMQDHSPAAVPGIFRRLAKFVQRIKNHRNYNESIGKDLGIVAARTSRNLSELKPEISGGLDAHRPLVKWKKGVADSLDIYVDRNDGKGFVFLTTDFTPDYIDTFPLPEEKDMAVWSYKGIYRIGDKQVGLFSDIVSISVTRQVGV